MIEDRFYVEIISVTVDSIALESQWDKVFWGSARIYFWEMTYAVL